MWLVVTVLDSVGSRNLSGRWGWPTGGILIDGHLIGCEHLIQLNKIVLNIPLRAKHYGRHDRVFQSK